MLPRLPASSKSTYEHALLVLGNKGNIGAAVISSHTCMPSYVSLFNVAIPYAESVR